jgi:AraC-like DNA-binding protein
MKPILEKLTTQESRYSFVLQRDEFQYYPTPWHYHPEYELVLVVKSHGQRIVGDSIENFEDGDLVFMGPNLPHVFNNGPEYYLGNPELRAEAIVIHFNETFAGKGFFELPEMSRVKKLLFNSKWGLKILGRTRRKIASAMGKMLHQTPARRLLHLIELLEELSISEEYRMLASLGYLQADQQQDANRMNKVYDYIMARFRNPLTLGEVAQVANLTPQSFCRFFKSRTRKTFSRFLNEVRVGYACKLMAEEHLNISDICYQSGYNNVSNFNRQFKRIVNRPPLVYRKEYLFKL